MTYNDINDVIGNDNISAATGDVKQSSDKWANEKRSQFGRFSLDILDRYVIAGTLRRDGTDKFLSNIYNYKLGEAAPTSSSRTRSIRGSPRHRWHGRYTTRSLWRT